MIETPKLKDDGQSLDNTHPRFRPRNPPLRPLPREVQDGPSAPTVPDRGSDSLTIELGQASRDRLERLETVLQELAVKLTQVHEQQDAMASMLAELWELLVDQRTIKDWYSPEEVAAILGKQPYTVREWCRYMRISARKRPTGRGDAKEWEISHEELERIKSHGLLPVPAKY